MDSLQMLNKQKTEFKEAFMKNAEKEKNILSPAAEELYNSEASADDLFFECNDKELEKRFNTEQTNQEVNVAMQMHRERHSHNVLNYNMMKLTREKDASDPDAGRVTENTLLNKEERKSEIPVNVMDMKTAEKQLNVTEVKEGEKQKQVSKTKSAQKAKEQEAPAQRTLPAGLKATMQSIINDKRWASKYYSNVQNAAKRLLEMDLNSKTDTQAVYSTMAELMNAAILYRDKRSGSRLLKKGRERAQWMDSLIGGMRDFTMEQNPVYMYHITEEWQNKQMGKKGYPGHLKKWMKAEAEKLPLANEGHSTTVSEYSFVFAVSMNNQRMKKQLADDSGWLTEIKNSKTNNQYERTAPLISRYLFHDINSDGTGMDEAADKMLAEQKENQETMKHPVPAERAKTLNQVLKKFMDMKFTPEMMSPLYFIRHMHELNKLGEALTLY